MVINNYNTVLQRIKNAALSAGSDYTEVKPMLVIKYAKDEDVLTILNYLDNCHAGESRVQDAYARWNQPQFQNLRAKVKLHYIGQLQSNKIGKAVALFDFIDSVSTLDHALFINTKAKEQGKIINCMVQLKLTDRTTQAGASLGEAKELIAEVKKLENINLCGIMAVAPQAENQQDLKPIFKEVKQFWDEQFKDKQEKYLSLGMSEDLEAAVSEGSNMPRIGSAIFD
ncbi:hypothetical protein Dip510_001531 [Elusimicrobium posterum]|uniref:YggS family pyridoxal phosphate-dependent enzyme n=1 Tax=Elusimicrobium posterum TaxID=3116653 RepID=UPI003C71890A